MTNRRITHRWLQLQTTKADDHKNDNINLLNMYYMHITEVASNCNADAEKHPDT